MTRSFAGAAAVVAAVLVAPPASAASFNCALAALPVEVAICNDEMLGSFDEEMASEYFALINTAPPDAALTIRAEQRDWLQLRNACGYDMQCILGAYRGRLQRLGEWREAVSGAPPSDLLGEPQDQPQYDGPQYDEPLDGEPDDPTGPPDESDGTANPLDNLDDLVVPYDDPAGDED